jgi:hypothetical protein
MFIIFPIGVLVAALLFMGGIAVAVRTPAKTFCIIGLVLAAFLVICHFLPGRGIEPIRGEEQTVTQ